MTGEGWYKYIYIGETWKCRAKESIADDEGRKRVWESVVLGVE